MLLACMMRKKGMPIRKIYVALKKLYSTIHNWLMCIDDGGLKRRCNMKKTGVQSKMNPDSSRSCAQTLMQTPTMRIRVRRLDRTVGGIHINKKYGTRYSTSSTYHLCTGKFSYRKPRAKTAKISLKIRDSGVQKESCQGHERYRKQGLHRHGSRRCIAHNWM